MARIARSASVGKPGLRKVNSCWEDSECFFSSRVCFLLGAGASYDHGYPTVREFLSNSYFEWLNDQARGLGSADDCRWILNDFLEVANRYSGWDENFEVLLTRLYDDAADYQRALEFINRTLAVVSANNIGCTVGYVAEFVGWAALLVASLSHRAMTVVTFNYDMSVEDAVTSVSAFLAASHMPTNPLYFNYGFDGRVWNEMPPGALNWGSKLPAHYHYGGVPILKLHGSLNLRFCMKCGIPVYSPTQMVSFPLVGESNSCPACEEADSLSPLLVPPGKRKSIPEQFQRIWARAEVELSKADLVGIVGYSLPTYDLEARSMLEIALQNKSLLLVDPNPSPEAVAFLRSVTGTHLDVLETTASKFFGSLAAAHAPGLMERFSSLCGPAYLFAEKMSGIKRL